MDRLIKRFAAEPDGDLMLVPDRGIAYQADMSTPVDYDGDYFDKCAGYDGQAIARAINAARVALVNAYAGQETRVVDIGIGSGEFIRSRPNTWGVDINPKAAEWLTSEGLWAENLSEFSAFAFWDVLEHISEPETYLRRVPPGGMVFVSIPIFNDLRRIRESKHYRPNEHFYYFTRQGFIDWMALYRFRLVECNDAETRAGRESILSFAFRRDLPGYGETLEQYQRLHAPAYGTTATMHLEEIAAQVLSLAPTSILDYGCGRSDLVAHFWADGRRKIAKYDPAIAEFKTMARETFDLVLCCDVMEHIRMEDVDRVLKEIWSRSANALFTISLRPARQVLPDGRNAHVTLLDAREWTCWIADVFGKAEPVATKWDHILMLKTW